VLASLPLAVLILYSRDGGASSRILRMAMWLLPPIRPQASRTVHPFFFFLLVVGVDLLSPPVSFSA